MATPSLAPVSALETRLGLAAGTLSGADLARAEADLADASALIRAEAGKTWVDADGVTITAPEVVVTVCVRAAKRSFQNPEDLIGENVGDYGTQRRETGVYLSDQEKEIVRKAAVSNGGSYDVQTPSAYAVTGTDPALYFWGLE